VVVAVKKVAVLGGDVSWPGGPRNTGVDLGEDALQGVPTVHVDVAPGEPLFEEGDDRCPPDPFQPGTGAGPFAHEVGRTDGAFRLAEHDVERV